VLDDDRVGILRENLERHAQTVQELDQRLAIVPGLLLVQVNGGQANRKWQALGELGQGAMGSCCAAR
jgi:hypothetical protein